MKGLKYIIAAVVVLGVVFVLVFKFFPIWTNADQPQYQFATVSRGDIETTISSTGTLSPLKTVMVGSQVSGTISRLYADFNQRVKKGQLLAVLDTTSLKATVMDAEASWDQAGDQLEIAQNNFRQDSLLYSRQLISESQYLASRIALKTQNSVLSSTKYALQRANYNLKNSYIISPITGTVISRDIEEGQTVAASLSAPVLFEIAENLSKIQIMAQVDESDIGFIKDHQPVRFEVAAYPGKLFTGQVSQIRLQPETVSNVVTYTVVINTTNDSGILLPGMTAMIDFVTDASRNVLKVPAAALHFTPSKEVMDAA